MPYMGTGEYSDDAKTPTEYGRQKPLEIEKKKPKQILTLDSINFQFDVDDMFVHKNEKISIVKSAISYIDVNKERSGFGTTNIDCKVGADGKLHTLFSKNVPENVEEEISIKELKEKFIQYIYGPTKSSLEIKES